MGLSRLGLPAAVLMSREEAGIRSRMCQADEVQLNIAVEDIGPGDGACRSSYRQSPC